MTPALSCPICGTKWPEGTPARCFHTDFEWSKFRSNMFVQEDSFDDVKIPRVRGIGRVSDNVKALVLYFDYRPTDDQMRAIHALLSDDV